MQRIRIRYTKDGRVRFVSARDLTSIWERALRRADLPIAYSEGYHPHPKVSFPDALPVGVASTGEYAELTFAAPVDPGPALASLSAQLPEGLSILTYQLVVDGAPKLARMLEVTLWEHLYPSSDDHDDTPRTVATLRRLGEALLAADRAPVQRIRPDGDTKVVDIRPALVAIDASARTPETPSVAPAVPIPTLRAILANDGPTVRPTDLHDALLAHATPDVADLPAPVLARRVAQGRLDDGALREALSGQRVVAVDDGGSIALVDERAPSPHADELVLVPGVAR